MVSKTYLRQKTFLKLPKYCNHRKASKPLFWTIFGKKKNSRFPFIYKALRAYLPQHCLYFLPEPHGLLYWGFWEILGSLGSLIRHLVASGNTP